MLNDTKHLSVQSFQRNQSLLEALNNYLIHIKLTAKGLDSKFQPEIIEAKGKKSRFTSVLFRQNPECVIEMLESENTDSTKELIKSLTELGNLIEDHLSTDTKEVIGDF